MNEYHLITANSDGFVYADSYKLEEDGSTVKFYRGKKVCYTANSVKSVTLVP